MIEIEEAKTPTIEDNLKQDNDNSNEKGVVIDDYITAKTKRKELFDKLRRESGDIEGDVVEV